MEDIPKLVQLLIMLLLVSLLTSVVFYFLFQFAKKYKPKKPKPNESKSTTTASITDPSKLTERREVVLDVGSLQDQPRLVRIEDDLDSMLESISTEEFGQNYRIEPHNQMKEDKIFTEEDYTILKTIREVHEDARKFERRVLSFSGPRYSADYFYLDENLMTSIEKLDRLVITDNRPLTEERKLVIKYIYKLLKTLDERVSY